jgi:hypothetical protein
MVFMRNYNKRIIPGLAELMKAKGATSNALAKRAGVGRATVHKVRHGVGIQSMLADCIEQALAKYEYNRLPPGRAFGAPWRKPNEE